eukprot:1052075-Prymnesium_polylepis.1
MAGASKWDTVHGQTHDVLGVLGVDPGNVVLVRPAGEPWVPQCRSSFRPTRAQAHRPLPLLRAMTSALSALLVGALAGLAGPADALVITALLPAVANFRDTPVSEK